MDHDYLVNNNVDMRAIDGKSEIETNSEKKGFHENVNEVKENRDGSPDKRIVKNVEQKAIQKISEEKETQRICDLVENVDKKEIQKISEEREIEYSKISTPVENEIVEKVEKNEIKKTRKNNISKSRWCSVPQCDFKGGRSLFGFPSDKELCKKWAINCKIGKKVSKYMNVCSAHFLKTDFFPKRKLHIA